MSLPTIFSACTPRQDVLQGAIAESDFAADLAQVVRGTASDEYCVPARFFDTTYSDARAPKPPSHDDGQFHSALEPVLEVLPVGRSYGGVELDGDLAASRSDFKVLEKLRRLAFSAQVDEPKQLSICAEAIGA